MYMSFIYGSKFHRSSLSGQKFSLLGDPKKYYFVSEM